MISIVSRRRDLTQFAYPGIAQILSSAVNFTVPLASSRWLTAEQFGIVVLVYGAIQLVVQIARTSIGEAALLSANGSIRSTGLFVTALAISFATCFIGVALLLWIGYPAKQATTFALLASVIVLVELLRYDLLVRRRADSVLRLNLIWLGLLLASVAIVRSQTVVTAQSIVMVWGVSALAAASPWLLPRIRECRAIRQIMAPPKSSIPLLLDGILVAAAPYLMLSTIAIVAGTAEVGVYRAATIPHLPVQLCLGVTSIALISNANSVRAHRIILPLVALIMVAYTWSVAAILTWTPPGYLEPVLGNSSAPSRDLAILSALMMTSAITMQILILKNKLCGGFGSVLFARAVYAGTIVAASFLLTVDSANIALYTLIAAQGLATVVSLFRRTNLLSK